MGIVLSHSMQISGGVVEEHSGEEAHVGSAHAVVGVAHRGEHPLSPCLAASVRTKEVEKD